MSSGLATRAHHADGATGGEPYAPYRLRAEMNGISEAPGKVWFFELAAAVVDSDRCVRCGACVAA